MKLRIESGYLQICYGPMDETLVTGGYDQAVKVWDCRSRSFEPLMTLRPFGDSVTSVVLSKRQALFKHPGCLNAPINCTTIPGDLPFLTGQLSGRINSSPQQESYVLAVCRGTVHWLGLAIQGQVAADSCAGAVCTLTVC